MELATNHSAAETILNVQRVQDVLMVRHYRAVSFSGFVGAIQLNVQPYQQTISNMNVLMEEYFLV